MGTCSLGLHTGEGIAAPPMAQSVPLCLKQVLWGFTSQRLRMTQRGWILHAPCPTVEALFWPRGWWHSRLPGLASGCRDTHPATSLYSGSGSETCSAWYSCCRGIIYHFLMVHGIARCTSQPKPALGPFFGQQAGLDPVRRDEVVLGFHWWLPWLHAQVTCYTVR